MVTSTSHGSCSSKKYDLPSRYCLFTTVAWQTTATDRLTENSNHLSNNREYTQTTLSIYLIVCSIGVRQYLIVRKSVRQCATIQKIGERLVSIGQDRGQATSFGDDVCCWAGAHTLDQGGGGGDGRGERKADSLSASR